MATYLDARNADGRYGDVKYLDTSAAYDNGSLILNVVNRSQTQAITAEIEAVNKVFSGPVESSEVNGPDIKAENDFGVTKVKTVKRTATAQGKSFQQTFAPHS